MQVKETDTVDGCQNEVLGQDLGQMRDSQARLHDSGHDMKVQCFDHRGGNLRDMGTGYHNMDMHDAGSFVAAAAVQGVAELHDGKDVVVVR